MAAECAPHHFWILPSAARPLHEHEPLCDEQVRQWREHGGCVVSGVVEPALVEAVRSFMLERCPAPGSVEANAINDFGAGPHIVFPSRECTALNELALHPRVLSLVSQLLIVPVSDIRLTQCDVWPKYGNGVAGDAAMRNGNQDQRIHCDFPNHTLVHPPPWHAPEAVEMILYLSDVDQCGGATEVVLRDGDDDPLYQYERYSAMPGFGPMKYVNDRLAAEHLVAQHDEGMALFRRRLYDRARAVKYGVGDVLLYRHDTWHRGTPLKAGALRVVCNMTFRRRECEWISTLHSGWSWRMYGQNQTVEKMVAAASVEQRCVLGFPAPGHRYWCPETLDAVERRYGAFGMDMTPYRNALL